MVHRCVVGVCMCACIVLATCGSLSRAASGSQVVKVTGTGSSIGTMKLIADALSKKYPAIRVDILPSIGSTGAIKAVKADKIDVGLSSRALRPDEQDREVEVVAYGRTPVVFGTHPNTSINDITIQDVEQIYRGQKLSWPDKTPVRLVLRPKSDAYTEFLARISDRMRVATEKSYSIPGLFTGITDQDAANQIERAVGSFAVTSLSLILSEGRNIKRLTLSKVAPTVKNLESGTYPFAMTMYLISRHNSPNPAVRTFIDFVFSREGQQILRETGHQPLKKPANQR